MNAPRSPTDPATRAIVERFLNAYPAQLPNRTDINPRALNTNSPQTIDDDNGGIRLGQKLGRRDRVGARYQFTAQHLLPFELVAGQNPDTTTKAHTARITWERSWSARTTTHLSAGFDRIRSLLVPAKGAVGPAVSISGLTTLGPLAGHSDRPRAEPVPLWRAGATCERQAHVDGGLQPAATPAQRVRDGYAPRLFLLHQRFRARFDHQSPVGHAEPEYSGDRQRQPRLSQLGHAVLRRRHLAGDAGAHAESRAALHARHHARRGKPFRADSVSVRLQ